MDTHTMSASDPFTDAPKGDRYVSVNGGTWLVSDHGRSYVRRDESAEWYGPSIKVYSAADLAEHGWSPVEPAPVVTDVPAVKFTLALLRTDPERRPIADVCNRCGAMVGDINTHRAWHGQVPS
jgi:hypothetical protein